MTKKITFLLAVFTLIFNATFSQRLVHERTSPWFFGGNIGATWQHTDVQNKTHYGWGLVFGRTFNRDYANYFSYDLKLRYLGGAWRGQNTRQTNFADYTNETLSQSPTDYKNTYNYSINNFQTKAHEINLELSVHLNRLTERTGLDPYIFGGVGATFFRAKGDLLDDMEYMYDYNLLSQFSKKEIANFKDNNFESDLDKSHNTINGKFMGHVGIGLGYYFTRNFAMGFEHKTTFSGVDYFDGVIADHGKFKKDIYHYTSIYFKVYFNRARAREGNSHVPPTNPTTPTNPSTPVSCPDPKIILKTASNSTVHQPAFQVNATIQNALRDGITLQHNGTQTGNFTYNNQQELKASFQLQNGLNTIVINTSNNCGSVQETIYVNYVPECDNPIVSFMSPNTSNSSTTNATIAIQAQVKNLGNGLLQLYVNGQQQTNFNYNASTGLLTSNIALQNGNNSIQIIASNNCGSTTQTVNVEYNKQCPTPFVSIQNQSNSNVTSNRYELSSVIENISNANQVEVYVNGQKQSIGTFSGRSFKKSLTLSNGKNTIVVRATNSCGSNEQSVTVEQGQPCIDPVITLTNPSGSRVTSNVSTFTVQATINHVTNPQNIIFKVNDKVITSFNYNIQTDLFTSTVQLNNGSNVIEISANNECGYTSTTATVSYTKPCEKPSLSWKQPVSNSTVTTKDITLEAHIQGINSASDVELLVNGTLQSAGTYSSTTTIYRKQVQLQKGNNVIQLIAGNNCGESNISLNVNYKDETVVTGDKPNVVFTNNCGVKVQAGIIKFTGNVLGVTETNQIQAKLQGNLLNNVVYKKITNGYSFEYELRVGYSQTYKMEISASNLFGTATQTCQISTHDAPVDKDLIICYTENRVRKTITIKESQWPQYEKLGATKGACPEVVDKDMVICILQKEGKVTLTIKESQWPQYQKAGATRGPCVTSVENDIVICVPNQNGKTTITIKESQWANYQRMGATLGKCPEVVDNDIIVCVPQGRTKVTMTIKESQWPQYQQMGATLGQCPIFDPEITICLRDGGKLNTLTIKQSEWPSYQAKGAVLGACPEVVDPEISICVTNADGTTSTLKIKQSQWSTYQAKGATMGACVTSLESIDGSQISGNRTNLSKMLICIQENGKYVTKTISTLDWKKYERLGATQGACVEKDGVTKAPSVGTPTTSTPGTIKKPVRP